MNPTLKPLLLLFCVVPVCHSSFVTADDSRAVYETEIDASIDDVWEAFTTSKGLQKWMAPLAEIEFVVGGKIKANYNAKGKLGDDTTIENTILSYDPKRMLSLKATGFPKGYPFVDASKNTWSVFYFSKVSSSRTKITVVGLGYTNSEQSKKMRTFFDGANKYSLDKLQEYLRSKKKPTSSKKIENDLELVMK